MTLVSSSVYTSKLIANPHVTNYHITFTTADPSVLILSPSKVMVRVLTKLIIKKLGNEGSIQSRNTVNREWTITVWLIMHSMYVSFQEIIIQVGVIIVC